MAERNPDKPQLDFPQLTADLIEQLRLVGPVGLLDFLDAVQPVYIVAQREGALDIGLTPPVFASAEISFGDAVNPASGAVIATTGPLAAGNYDIFAEISANALIIVGGSLVVEHRNAADTVTLARLLYITLAGTMFASQAFLPTVGYEISLNERLSIAVTGIVSGVVAGMIAARLRPTP